MPFPIVRPNPMYRSSSNAAAVRPFGTGPGTGSNITSPRGSAIGRSSSSTEPVQMVHAASAYEMNWMNATDDGGGSIGPSRTSFVPPSVFSLSHEEIDQREGLFPSAPRRRRDNQYSTDDEEFEEVGMSDTEGVSVTLEQSNTNTSSMMPPGHSEDDSQQAAEAMVQLSGTQYYNATQEESMEIDPNYDPSDFLGMSNRTNQAASSDTNVYNQGAVDGAASVDQTQSYANSEYVDQSQQAYQQGSEAGIVSGGDGTIQSEQGQPTVAYDPATGMPQQQQQEQQEQEQQPQQQQPTLPTLQSLHSDLAISDSDDEKSNLRMDVMRDENENDDNDDGDGLWF
uniref:Putative transcription initiation factor tfiid subunit 1 n=1 Tax=Anopheles marajoara TaxID=58244 RepID=A0A2M4BTE0_9DIPT